MGHDRANRAPPASPTFHTLGVVALGALLLAVLAMLLDHVLHNSFRYLLFTDRELLRGARLWTDLPTTGPEMTGAGVRLPGPLLPLLFGLPRLVSTDPHAVYALQWVGAGASVLVLARSASRHLGPWIAVAAVYLSVAPQLWRDTLTLLWNPGFLPLPIALMTAGLLSWVVGRDPRGLTWFGVGAGLGVQIHMSTMALVAASLPVLYLTRPPGAGAALRRAAMWFGLLLAPYLVGEVLTGGANLRIGWEAGGGGPPRGPWWNRVADQVVMLADARHAAGWWQDLHRDPVSVAMRTMPWVAGLLGLVGAALRRGQDPDARRPSDRASLALGSIAALYLVSLGASSTPEPVPRYLMAVLPVLGVATAAGVQASLTRLGHLTGRAPALAVAVLLFLGTAWGFGGGRIQLPDDVGTWRGLTQRIDALQQHQGWTLEDVTRRTLWTHWDAQGRLSLQAGPSWPGTGILLHNAGVPFQGSGAPPCALYIHPSDGAPLSLQDTRRVLDEAVPRSTLLADFVPAPGERVLIYAPHEARCPTSMVQRYVDLATEAELHRRWRDLPCLQGAPLPAPPDTARFATTVPVFDPDDGCRMGQTIAAAIDLHLTPGGLTATLHSNQLRGRADNTGWYSSARIVRPTVWLEPLDGGPPTTLPIHDGTVGGVGIATPLTTPREPWTPTPSRVVWMFGLLGPPNRDEAPPRPLSVVLSERWPAE